VIAASAIERVCLFAANFSIDDAFAYTPCGGSPPKALSRRGGMPSDDSRRVSSPATALVTTVDAKRGMSGANGRARAARSDLGQAK
jgi:hypothetical protein